jgi:hypothetical protein
MFANVLTLFLFHYSIEFKKETMVIYAHSSNRSTVDLHFN